MLQPISRRLTIDPVNNMSTESQALPDAQPRQNRTSYRVLGAISFSHMLNDMVQSLILAIYPLLKGTLHLTFAQIGLITLTYQLTASILQPLVGLYTDKHPKPFSLTIGMGFTLVGLVLMSMAHTFHLVLIAAAIVGMGSSIFHPESSRVARMASGGQFGMAQSVFQVGGNAGSSLGPLLAALIIAPSANGQANVAWFSLAALLAMIILFKVGQWYKIQHRQSAARGKQYIAVSPLPGNKVVMALGILLILIFSKYFYMASLGSYFTFYLMHKFQLSEQSALFHLFLFMFAVAAGTVIGGPVGDRIGRKYVIWFSILGVAPFTLMLPYANLFWTSILVVIIGLILASAFSAILVYAQELIPGKVGMIAGLFFGLAFGMGGIGAASLGWLSDRMGIDYVYHLCSFLPLLGILTVFLPNIERRHNS